MSINDTDIAKTTFGFEANIVGTALDKGHGDVADVCEWCRHAGRGHKPHFCTWDGMPIYDTAVAVTTSGFGASSNLPLSHHFLTREQRARFCNANSGGGRGCNFTPPSNFAHRPARDTNPVSTPNFRVRAFQWCHPRENPTAPSTGNPRWRPEKRKRNNF